MTRELLIFAGTTEGRELITYCRRNGLGAEVVVSSDYGRELIAESESIRVSAGRLTQEAVEEKMREGIFDMVIDASHPRAREAGPDIRLAAKEAALPYLRVCRREADSSEGIHVATVEEAVEFLSHTKGNILAVTGSKELSKYRKLADYRNRVYPRIAPDAQTILDCMEMGFDPKHVICMEEPLSRGMNEAMLLETKSKWMVTKEAGREEGFDEKAQAARQAGAQLVVVGRPSGEEGYSLNQTYDYLKKFYRLSSGRSITLVGVGMGSEALLTEEAKEAIVRADLCMGAERVLVCAKGYSCQLQKGTHPEEVFTFLAEHSEYENVCILLSGDTGFYSGARALKEALQSLDATLRILPGISSMSYLCAKLRLSYEEVKAVNYPGRNNLVYQVDTNPAVFTLLNGPEGMQDLCQELIEYGLEDVRIAVGENLSYKEEKITVGTPEELVKNRYTSLCAAVIQNLNPRKQLNPGISDEEFLRGEVPMTEEEVRVIALAKLGLEKDSVVYDIGAGTGSMAVEAAREAFAGTVYAVEEQAEAVDLIRKNRKKFRTSNLIPVYGEILEACTRLEPPTHAFIGDCKGKLGEILVMLLTKNPKIQIVLTTDTLETVSDMLVCIRELPFVNADIVEVQTSRAQVSEKGCRMQGQGPVFVISCRGQKTER